MLGLQNQLSCEKPSDIWTSDILNFISSFFFNSFNSKLKNEENSKFGRNICRRRGKRFSGNEPGMSW